MDVLEVREIKAEIYDQLKRYDFSRCHSCGSCASGCPIPGIPGMDGWDPCTALRMINFGLIDEVVDSCFPWVCTGCGRCSHACPMGIDLVPIWNLLKSLRSRDKVPGVLWEGVLTASGSDGDFSISKIDCLSAMASLGAEFAEHAGLPGFFVPVDQPDAHVLFYPSSRELFGDYDEMAWWWKIFYAANEKWSIPSVIWEAFEGGPEAGAARAGFPLSGSLCDQMQRTRRYGAIESSADGELRERRTGRKNLNTADLNGRADGIYFYDYLRELIEQGRITIDKSLNEGKLFTWHDSCKHGRELERQCGHGYYDEARWILKQCIGEDQFVEMTPNRANSYCCGAGGATWPMPYEKESIAHGRFKVRQIRDTGANIVVVGCTSCRDQIQKRLPKYYPGECDYEVKSLWQLVAESLAVRPWSAAQIARAKTDAHAQWKKLRIEV